MEKRISNLQFITNHQSEVSHLWQVENAIEAGVDWIQYRPKDKPMRDILNEAKEILNLCRKSDVVFIINDLVNLTAQIGADGVHLGKYDMTPKEARSKLGPKKIIGGTANNLEEVLNLVEQGVDYIGLGPFKQSNTKEDSSPLLDIPTYQSILSEMKKRSIETPVVAVGGIKPEFVKTLKDTGVFGVAFSSVLSEARESDRDGIVKLIKQKLSI
jgi:thiamine-phosphate pyrophosphorylase